MTIRNFFSLTLGAGLVISSSLYAQTTVSTPVVGFEKTVLPANSLLSWGSSLLHPAVYTAQITSVGSDSITFSGSDNIGSKLTAGEPYYLEVKSGAAEGARLDLVTADTIALANPTVKILTASSNNTDTLASLTADLASATAVIRKHNTVKDIGDRISNLTSGASGVGDEIIVFNPSTSGFETYLRRTSTTWRDGNNVTVNSVAIPPGSGVIIRKRAVSGEVLTTGQVRQNKFQFNTSAGNQLVAMGFPLDYSFAEIGATNAASGWTYGTTGDKFYVMDSTGAFNTYLYRTSTSWRDGNNAVVTTNQVLKSGMGYVLFKNAGENYLYNPPN